MFKALTYSDINISEISELVSEKFDFIFNRTQFFMQSSFQFINASLRMVPHLIPIPGFAEAQLDPQLVITAARSARQAWKIGKLVRRAWPYVKMAWEIFQFITNLMPIILIILGFFYVLAVFRMLFLRLFCYDVSPLFATLAVKVRGNHLNLHLPLMPQLGTVIASQNLNVTHSPFLDSSSFVFDTQVDPQQQATNMLKARITTMADVGLNPNPVTYVGDPDLVYFVNDQGLKIKLPPGIKFHRVWGLCPIRIKWTTVVTAVGSVNVWNIKPNYYTVVSKNDLPKLIAWIKNNFNYNHSLINVQACCHIAYFLDQHYENLLSNAKKGSTISFSQIVQLAHRLKVCSNFEDIANAQAAIVAYCQYSGRNFHLAQVATNTMAIPRCLYLE